MFDLRAASDVVFLALAIWREASGEPHAVRVAVACSILNRVDRPSWWGGTITEVLFKKWQYSSLTAPGDPNLVRWPSAGDLTWRESLQIARDVIEGLVTSPVPCADSYFDVSIAAPEWATPDRFVAQLGRVRFYNTDHDHEAAVLAKVGA